jgi:hypothetical protein
MQRYQPALLGGLFIGVLSSLPLVGSANICCCLWVVVGGVLTAYLQQQSRPTPLEGAEAALGGLLAGVVGGIISVAAAALLLSGATTGVGIEDRLREMLDNSPQVSPEVRDTVLNLVAGQRFFLLVAVVTLPIYSVFGMLGALLGLAIFRKKNPPPATPSIDGAS